MTDAAVQALDDLAVIAVVAVFLASALGKLLDPAAFRSYLNDVFRRPLLTGQLSVATVVAWETALSVGLVVTPARRWAAGAAVITLAAFSAVLASPAHAGKECRCFGATKSTPRRSALVRNVALMLVSGCIAATPANRFDPMLDVILGLAGLSLALGWLLLQTRRAAPLPATPTDDAPWVISTEVRPSPVTGVRLTGADFEHPVGLGAERPVVLLFLSEDCMGCRFVASVISSEMPKIAAVHDLVVCADGRMPELSSIPGLRLVAAESASGLLDTFGVEVFPHLSVVIPSGDVVLEVRGAGEISKFLQM